MSKQIKIKKREPLIVARVEPKFKFSKVKLKRLFSQQIDFKTKDKITLTYERNLNPYTDLKETLKGDDNKPGWTCTLNHKTGTINSNQVIETNQAISKIFLGAVYNLKDLVVGNPTTVPYARKPLTVMVDSHHFKTSSVTVEKPFKHQIREAVNKIIRSKDMADTPITSGKMGMFDSYSSLVSSFSGSGHYLGFGGSHKISFESERKTHKFYLEASQLYYTLSVSNDINEPEDFFHLKEDDPNINDAVSKNLISPNWVYVDTVGYGRMLHFIFESDESYEGMDIDLKQYADYLLAAVELNEKVKEKIKKRNVSIQVVAIGGSPLIAGILTETSPENFRKQIRAYFKGTNDEVPISYSLSTLDNQTVGTHMYVDYESRICHPKPTKFRIVWESVNCLVNDDGGDSEQVNARVRIRALDNEGVNILDIDKLNLMLLNLIKTKSNWKALFWTFFKGNEDNPLNLKPNKAIYLNKSITFPLKSNRGIAKIVITADITEFDFGPNDNFQKDEEIIKVKDIIPDKLYTLTCRHEDSEIVFGFRIHPEYD